MPLQLPNLDDRKYADLVDEARSLIPTYAPEWTNHNPADPGITLIELFAYLAEMLLYRLNRVTDQNVYMFLKLLNGPAWEPAEPRNLTEEIRKAVLALRRPNRTITCADFESLALAADPQVARAHCVPRRNLETENPLARAVDSPGHVSIVILPFSEQSNPQPGDELIKKVKKDLEPRRLLTTQAHVVGPRYVKIGVRLTVVLKADAVEDKFLFNLDLKYKSDLDAGVISAALRQELKDKGVLLSAQVTVSLKEADKRWLITDEQTQQTYTVRKERDVLNQEKLNLYEDMGRPRIIRALKKFLHPLTGGPKGTGWPFGRNVNVSEIYELLDRLPEVDFVTKTGALDELTTDDPKRLQRNLTGELVAVEIQQNELVEAQIVPDEITIIKPR
jgi:hypothetical protein